MNNNNNSENRDIFFKVEYKFLIQQSILPLVLARLKESFDVSDNKYISIEEKSKPKEREKILTRDEKAIKEEQAKERGKDKLPCFRCKKLMTQDEVFFSCDNYYFCDKCFKER